LGRAFHFGLGLILVSFVGGAVFASPKKCRKVVSDAVQERPKEIFVVDTNAFYSDPELLSRFSDKDLVIARSVIAQELDRHKRMSDDRSLMARHTSKEIEALMEKFSHLTGAPLDKGGSLHITEVTEKFLNETGLFEYARQDGGLSVDARIVALAVELQQANPHRNVVILSGDRNVRNIARSFGITTQEVTSSVNPQVMKEIIEGPVVIEVSAEQAMDIGREDRRSLTLEEAVELGFPANFEPYHNQFLYFKIKDSSDRFDFVENTFPMRLLYRWQRLDKGRMGFARPRKEIPSLPVTPKNPEQLMALDLLLDPRVELVTLAGGAGTGKTLVTLMSALAQSSLYKGDKAQFKEIVLTRPNQVTGRDVGFLPGDLEKKLSEYMKPFEDNFAKIFTLIQEGRGSELTLRSNGIENRKLKALTLAEIAKSDGTSVRELVGKIMKSDFVTVQSITYARGRTWDHALIVIDEAQNLTLLEALTIVSRAGEGSKVVLLGDLDQIDSFHLNHSNNGLAITASRFNNQSLAGHVTLRSGERSRLSTLATKLLRPEEVRPEETQE
jgi:PhoH-like ATPase